MDYSAVMDGSSEYFLQVRSMLELYMVSDLIGIVESFVSSQQAGNLWNEHCGRASFVQKGAFRALSIIWIGKTETVACADSQGRILCRAIDSGEVVKSVETFVEDISTMYNPVKDILYINSNFTHLLWNLQVNRLIEVQNDILSRSFPVTIRNDRLLLFDDRSNGFHIVKIDDGDLGSLGFLHHVPSPVEFPQILENPMGSTGQDDRVLLWDRNNRMETIFVWEIDLELGTLVEKLRFAADTGLQLLHVSNDYKTLYVGDESYYLEYFLGPSGLWEHRLTIQLTLQFRYDFVARFLELGDDFIAVGSTRGHWEIWNRRWRAEQRPSACCLEDGNWCRVLVDSRGRLSCLEFDQKIGIIDPYFRWSEGNRLPESSIRRFLRCLWRR